ncbi:MAG: sugar ABC transporter substrate-binding protein [Devosia sp.]|uniref:ABC transporter substrate-binding protein n=1 Tax=unclassified Devosia TaxID=196773 RepID=UPI00092CDB35|nr:MULTISPECIES: sugar ABC transporter substrate-binding protein [unclassified Devosia]MBL8597605.1 sugar ABC transporter substrate-binding protein [Devosia sp.]MBN9346308.1 sugar ABC transporter substrate-binding protein [Devosia sp.]OJX47627.1 MAG: sugar ABC transporter [Devosia sp. 66-22]
MKLTVILAAAAMAASALVPLQVHAQDAPVNLVWQMWGDEKDTPLWESLAALVTEEYPNITVTPQISGWTDYWTRLPILASSGQIGDLVAMQSMRMPSFYSVLEPLDSYFATDSFDVSAFETSIIGGLSHEGTHYALPYDVGPWLVFYNHDKFAAAGLADPAMDWTFDDFKAAALKLSTDGNYGYAAQTFDFIAAPVALGAEYFNDANAFDLTNAGYVDAVGKFVDLVAVDKASPLIASGATDSAYGRFSSGNAAMYIDGPWSLISTQGAVDFKMGVAPLPRGDGASRFITAGSGWGISAASKNKDAAYKALKVLTGPKAAQILASGGRALPGRLAEQSYWYDVAAKDVIGAREALTYAFEHSTPFRLNDKWNEFENLLTQYIPLALNGDSTTQAVLADIQSQLP